MDLASASSSISSEKQTHATKQRSHATRRVHTTEESSADYHALKRKWGKYLPLGKQTGDPLKDFKCIFPSMFDGTFGLFDGEVDLMLPPDAQLTVESC